MAFPFASLNGTPSAAGTAPAGALTDRVQSLYSYLGTTLAGNLLGALVLAWLFWGVAPHDRVTGWVISFSLVWFWRLWLAIAYRRAAPTDDRANGRWLRLWNVGTLGSGLVWGASAWLFFGAGDSLHQVVLVLVIYSYCVGAVPILATQWTVFLLFIGFAFVPTIIRLATGGDADGPAVAVVIVLVFIMTATLGRNYRHTFEHLVETKARAQRLLEQLRVEKAAADAARREAELANRAKTQFFAAASHDLRQPLHALVLFSEALRGKSQDVEVVNLVNSINSSVDALEGLFSELLDITKIDTGGVEPRPVDFSLEDVFRKLRLHFEPVAFEKGLAFTVRGGHHHAFADPVLVERILRNLVSNAIRYTEDGGVLVAARKRGDRLLLQVWDSGVGIAARDQERVFDEFVQISENAPALEAHQRKGLGLGLAIVRRLASLMRAPLTLHSRPGHGTVFALELPLGRAQRAQAQPSSQPAMLGLTLDRRLVVMVEDDAAVRSGLEVLLKSWGASVIAFDSVAACLQWVGAAEPSQLTPDLVIADYRLESGHTGVEAILAVREQFGRTVPAIVVTGSVMSHHEQEAQDRDFHLLIKPVVPNKLRAMIAFKLGMR